MECRLSFIWAWQISWELFLTENMYPIRIQGIHKSTIKSGKSNRRIEVEFLADVHFLYTKASTISAMIKDTKK
jgi:hypothetical protein